MIDIKDKLIASARLAILRFLAEDSDYKLNSSILEDALAAIGLDMTRVQIETMCAWLAERDLVKTEQRGSVLVVTLTARGGHVVSGHVRIDGIKRPAPGEAGDA